MNKTFSLIIVSILLFNVAVAHQHGDMDMPMSDMNHEQHPAVVGGGNEHLSIEFKKSSSEPRVGDEVQFIFRPSEELEEAHGALIHVIGVRKDLKEFFHTHADLELDGTLVAVHTFDESGSYRVWAEAIREGMLHRFEYDVAVRPNQSWISRLMRTLKSVFGGRQDVAVADADVSSDVQKKFSELSANGNSSCTPLFKTSISYMKDTDQLQGSCCSPMNIHRYREQVEGLKVFKSVEGQNIEEIPDDPYDVNVAFAQELISYYDSELSADEQRAYDYAMENSNEKGPCCCKCWRWYVYGGLGKLLIQKYNFTGEQVMQVWNLSDGCGGEEEHHHT